LVGFLGISSDFADAVDVLERYWMVGRVPTAFSTQLIDFAKNKKFRFPRGPYFMPLQRVAVSGRYWTSTPSFLTLPISVLA
jgi:hypothetical protein